MKKEGDLSKTEKVGTVKNIGKRGGIFFILALLFVGSGKTVTASQKAEDLITPFASNREEGKRLMDLQKEIEQIYADIDSMHLFIQERTRAIQSAHATYVLEQGSINFAEYDTRLKNLREQLDKALQEDTALRLKMGLSPVFFRPPSGAGEGERYTGAPLFAFYTPPFVREGVTAGPIPVWRWIVPLMIIGIMVSALFWRYLAGMPTSRKATLYPMLKVVRKNGVREPLTVYTTNRAGVIFLSPG